jgi:hypothetical protein
MLAKKYLILPLFTSILVTGCASVGSQFDTTHVNDIQLGTQNKNQIMEWFGEPNSKITLSESPLDCKERWQWTYAHAVGFGKVTESHSLVVDFNSDDKVCDKAYSKY